jgi:predicted RNA binding protein YcfA (HicA-like mRNA interferase family)
VKVGEVIELLKGDGWYVAAIRGSHRQLKHHVKRGRVTVPGKASDDLHPKTLASILRQAGLRR